MKLHQALAVAKSTWNREKFPEHVVYRERNGQYMTGTREFAESRQRPHWTYDKFIEEFGNG